MSGDGRAVFTSAVVLDAWVLTRHVTVYQCVLGERLAELRARHVFIRPALSETERGMARFDHSLLSVRARVGVPEQCGASGGAVMGWA